MSGSGSGGVRRVGVNLAWLVPGVVGGSEESTVAMLHAAADHAADFDIEIVLFGLASLRDAHPELVARFEFCDLELNGANKVRRVLAENTRLGRAARAQNLALIHHAGGVVPPGVGVASTLLIHDTQPLDLPQNFSLQKRLYLRAMIGRSARAARRIITSTEFVKAKVIEHTSVSAAKIDVVPFSLLDGERPTAAGVAAVAAKYRLECPFVLYAAIPYVHKNHETLLSAMRVLVSRGSGLDLVLTGGPGPCDDLIAAAVADPVLAGRVRRLGRVPRTDLVELMGAAAVVAIPSRYEGFGLPALEAMSFGTPTVVSAAGALPEVVGDGALVIDPDNAIGWADALEAAANDPATAQRLVSAGYRVAATFTPERTALGTLRTWATALEG
ncbi:MAG: glycosyltransferase family 4 protein [Actinobacteria bacterium]|nr:glycosyltransferase family 4 protein [Actinomycetota bacterium]